MDDRDYRKLGIGEPEVVNLPLLDCLFVSVSDLALPPWEVGAVHAK